MQPISHRSIRPILWLIVIVCDVTLKRVMIAARIFVLGYFVRRNMSVFAACF